MNSEIRKLLEGVKDGTVSVDDALLQIKKQPFEDIDFAKVDLHRKARKGVAEVIYGASKTPEQIIKIIQTMQSNGQNSILVTRLSEESAKIISEKVHLEYRENARIGIIGGIKKPDGLGKIVVATGGTSDIPVAEEAAITAEFFGNEVSRLYDVGVAGLHRLMNHLDEIMNAQVIIAIA